MERNNQRLLRTVPAQNSARYFVIGYFVIGLVQMKRVPAQLTEKKRGGIDAGLCFSCKIAPKFFETPQTPANKAFCY